MKQMLINAVHHEQKRMAVVDEGKLIEYNIQMAIREPITGNIYKGTVMKVERGLQAAFVNHGGKKDGFLPLRDVSPEYFGEGKDNGKEGNSRPRHSLKMGQTVLVQVLREVGERKGALLTTYISLPGRYLVLLPNKPGGGISRKIEDEEDRKRLKALVEQIKVEEDAGFIVRTAGMNRTKQELSRDYQHLWRLWKEIVKRAETTCAPALIYQESDFGVRSVRDYYTSEIQEILVDEMDTFRKVRAYCKAVSPRTMRIIKLYKDKVPLFDKFQLEDQIKAIYQERVELRSGGHIVISPTEAMITIDVNSGKASHKRNVEETAFKTNLDAAEEIARQLRLRDLGGLIVIDFIDMMDRKNVAEIEKAFKKAMSVDRARVQLAHISKFGILELSRQKKQSTIQEISYTACPHCRGTGTRPSLEYAALGALRKITTQAVKGTYAAFRVTLPAPVADYLLNHKRNELAGLESTYDMSIHICGSPDMTWDEIRIETTVKETPAEMPVEPERQPAAMEREAGTEMEEGAPPALEADRTAKKPEERHEEHAGQQPEGPAKKGRRRSRHRRRRSGAKKAEQKAPEETEHAPGAVVAVEAAPVPALRPETGLPAAVPPSTEPATPAAEKGPRGDRNDLLKLLQQAFDPED